jgi:excisionase family DNA binding protein
VNETSDALHALEAVTVSEIAASMEVSKRTVERWIHDEALPAFKVGRTTRVLLADFRAFVDAHKAAGSAATVSSDNIHQIQGGKA